MSDKIKLYRYISVLYMDEPMDGKTYYYKTNKYDLVKYSIAVIAFVILLGIFFYLIGAIFARIVTLLG